MSRSDPTHSRLMLILSPDTAPREAAAWADAGDVAAAVIRHAGTAPDATQLKALAQPLQQRDCAVLLEDLPDPVGTAGLDGIQAGDALRRAEALKRLKPDGIVGAGGLLTRHEAMEAGESGADYVLFGPLNGDDADFPRICALVEWWSPLFEVPCAAVARSPVQVAALARAGADFIALAASWTAGPDGVAAVRAAQDAISGGAPDPAP